MSSPSDFATGSQASPGDAGGVPGETPESDGASAPEENEAVKVEDSLADLQRDAAAMLRTLADRYAAESADKRAIASRLRAESDAAETLASQLADESSRVRADADRLGTPPTWMSGSTSGGTESEPVSPETGASDTGASDAGSSGTSDTGDPSAEPGPAPARGFAGSSSEEETKGEATDAASASQSSGAPEDWAPRPFESWRNQTSRVVPRLSGL